jgi:hypothetical protein
MRIDQPDAREADRTAGSEISAAALDLAPVEGDWVSVTDLAGGISRLRARERDGSLIVSARGHGEPRPGEWGETEAVVFANALESTAGYAFTATFDGEQVSSQLQTYQGLGVLVVHAFHRHTDDSGRRDYFTREFYVPPHGPPADEGPALRSEPVVGNDDPGDLLGTWQGLAPAATRSIGLLECTRADGRLIVRAQGVGAGGPVDWGTAHAHLYADAHYLDNPPAFLVTFDHGYMRVHLQARINRGVLVVGEYTEFTDASGRSNYFIRECYRR